MTEAFGKIRKERGIPPEKPDLTQEKVARARKTPEGTDFPEEFPSIQNIRANPDSWVLFRNMGVHSARTPDDKKKFIELYTKMEAGEALTDAQRKIQENLGLEFGTRLRLADECKAMLSEDTILAFKPPNPIAGMIARLGPKRATELMRAQVNELIGLGTKDKVDYLRDLHRSLGNCKGVYSTKNYQKVTARAAQIREKYGLTPKQYAEFTKGDDTWETAKRVRAHLAKDLGWVGRIKHAIPDMARGWKLGRVRQLEIKSERDGALSDLQKFRAQALGSLTMVFDEDFLANIDHEVTHGSPQGDKRREELKTKERNLALKQTIAELEKTRNDDWERHKKDPTLGYGTLEREQQEARFDEWQKDWTQKHQQEVEDEGKGGLFSLVAKILAALFATRVRSMKKPEEFNQPK